MNYMQIGMIMEFTSDKKEKLFTDERSFNKKIILLDKRG